MNKDLQDYYENYFEMFATKGWKQLMEEVDESIDAFKIDNINNEQELMIARGQLSQLRSLKGLQSVIEQAYEDLDASQVRLSV